MKLLVHKYVFNSRDTIQNFVMPYGAEIISIQSQRGDLTLWAEHTPGHNDTELRSFMIVCTGSPVECEYPIRHLSTVQLEGGGIVLHIYERMLPKDHRRSPDLWNRQLNTSQQSSPVQPTQPST